MLREHEKLSNNLLWGILEKASKVLDVKTKKATIKLPVPIGTGEAAIYNRSLLTAIGKEFPKFRILELPTGDGLTIQLKRKPTVRTDKKNMRKHKNSPHSKPRA